MPEYSLTRRRELLALGVTEALPDHALAMQPESRDQRSRRTDSGRQEAWHHATARVEQPQVSRFARVRAPIRPNSNCHGQPVPAAPPVWTSMPSHVKVTVLYPPAKQRTSLRRGSTNKRPGTRGGGGGYILRQPRSGRIGRTFDRDGGKWKEKMEASLSDRPSQGPAWALGCMEGAPFLMRDRSRRTAWRSAKGSPETPGGEAGNRAIEAGHLTPRTRLLHRRRRRRRVTCAVRIMYARMFEG